MHLARVRIVLSNQSHSQLYRKTHWVILKYFHPCSRSDFAPKWGLTSDFLVSDLYGLFRCRWGWQTGLSLTVCKKSGWLPAFVRDSRPRAPPVPCVPHSFGNYSSAQQTFVKGFPCSPSQITALSWQRGLQNSVKLWAMLCRATQDGQVVVRVLTKHDPLEEGTADRFSMLAVRTSWNLGSQRVGHAWATEQQQNFLMPDIVLGAMRDFSGE